MTLGTHQLLALNRLTDHGAYLDGGELGEILLPSRYVPLGVGPGNRIRVFIHRDSEDRVVATTEKALAQVGEFACLRVAEVHGRIGVFLDWGLSKDLLLPYREMGERNLRVGDEVVVAVTVDQQSDRIIASTRLDRHFSSDEPDYAPGDKVEALLYARTPLGYNTVINHRHPALLYQPEDSNELAIGQTVTAYIRQVRPDGKIDLSRDASGYERIMPLADQILAKLKAHRGRLFFDDQSPPEAIRDTFGVSKKAFKQALGQLYKQGEIVFKKPGIQWTGQDKD
jgi:predicted RNA-binding protein (virulence factor B family)